MSPFTSAMAFLSRHLFLEQGREAARCAGVLLRMTADQRGLRTSGLFPMPAPELTRYSPPPCRG